MDLTPKKSSSDWWSVFSCCRPPATSYAPGAEEAPDEDGSYIKDHGENTATAPSSSIKLKVALPDSPDTACTDSSEDDGEVSFESHEVGDYARQVAVSTPKRGNSSSSALPLLEVDMASYEEKEDTFIGEVSISTPRYSNSIIMSTSEKNVVLMKTSDNNDMSVPEDVATGSGNEKISLEEEDGQEDEDEDIPDIDFPLMKPPTPAKTSQKSAEQGNSNKPQFFKSALEEQPVETTFHQFLCVMLLRHIFGYWLQGDYDPTTNIFNPSPKMLLTQGGNSERKEYGKMMKLRKLWFKDGNKCEVVPQLRRE